MINDIQKSIDAINNNLSILPTDTKKNKAEYIKYIDLQLADFNQKLKQITDELDARYNKYVEKYTTGTDLKIDEKIDILSLKFNNSFFGSYERMNLPYYIYEIGHYYKEDLDKTNEVIFTLIDSFEKVGITLTIEDFNYTEVVSKYMGSLLGKKEDIHQVFEMLYWENPNLINQIELNFRYLYFKYKKKIDGYFKKKKSSFEDIINQYKDNHTAIDKYNHTSIKYISSLILNKTVLLTDVSEKNIKSITSELFLKEDEANHYNLLKLKDSLFEYKYLMRFIYIIDNLKKLFEHKQEYKGVYNNKFKEISKKEKELFKLNRKINSRFSSSDTKLMRNNCIIELYRLYRELDDLKINDTIFTSVNNDTSYYNLLMIASANFNYFVKLLKEQNDIISMNDINNNIIELFKFVYCNDLNIINNISITEDKNIPQIISDRYRLVNINIGEDKITEDTVDSYLKNLDNVILSYDIINNKINTEELEFIMYVNQMKEK